MIYEIISAVSISVTVSFIMSLGLVYMMHKKITVRDVQGLKVLLDGKADARHAHFKEDIINFEDILPTDYAEVEVRDEP